MDKVGHFVGKIVGFLFLLSASFFLNAQNMQKIDSLKKKLTAISGESRFSVLVDLAWEYRFAYPDSTIIYAQQGSTLAQELNLPLGRAKALNYIGVAYVYKGNPLKAYDYYNQALAVSLQQNDSIQLAYSNNNLGNLLFNQGLLAKAYDYYIKSYAIFQKLNDRSGLAYTLQSLGNLQLSQKDFDQSEKQFYEAYRLRLKLGNKRDIMSSLIMVGKLYYERKEFEKSTRILFQADSVGQLIHDEINLAEIKILVAKNYIELGRIDEAEQVAEAGAKVITRLQFKRLLSESLLILGNIKMQRGKFREASDLLKSSLKISFEIRDLKAQMNAYRQLWKLSEAQQNKSEAVAYMNQYLILNDSIKDLDLTRQVERLQFQLDIEKKEKENELLKLTKANQSVVIGKQQAQNVLLFLVLVCLLALAGISWYYNRKRRRTNLRLKAQNMFIELQRQQIEKRNIDLSAQNQNLEDLNHEKDVIMSIVAHDLKSPLTSILGLLNLMTKEGELLPVHREYLRMIREVTQSNLNLIVDLLDVNALQTDLQVPKPVAFDLDALLDERISIFQFAAENKKIALRLTHPPEGSVVSNPGYISRIVDNLVSNALKFSPRGSSVDVDAKLIDGILRLAIKDNGPGFSETDKLLLYQRFKRLSARPTAGESSNGLGLAIVKTLVDRLQGEITLNSTAGKGSEFIVRIPVQIVEMVSA
jgi:signal transduction histidine kinase